MEAELVRIYYTPSHPASFSSVPRLLKAIRKTYPNTSAQVVRKWLKGQLTYTLHRATRRNFSRNQLITNGIDYQWQADLVDMTEFSKFNKNYKFILTVIDTFSKYAWAVPLKSKSGVSVKNAFLEIFQNGRSPHKLQTDKGKEFVNSIVAKLLKQYQIQFFTSQNSKIKWPLLRDSIEL